MAGVRRHFGNERPGRPDRPPVPAELRHLQPQNARGAALVLACVALTATGVWLSLRPGAAAWAAGQLLTAAALLHWFVILHECGHETLFRTRRWHRVGGPVAGVLSLIPFASWTRVHGTPSQVDRLAGPRSDDRRARAAGAIDSVERAIVNVCWRLVDPAVLVRLPLENYWNLPRLMRHVPGAARPTRDRGRLSRRCWRSTPRRSWCSVLQHRIRVAGLAVLLSLVAEDVLLLSQHAHVPQHVSHGAAVRPYPAPEQEAFTRSLRLPSLGVRMAAPLRRARAPSHVSVRARLSPARIRLSAGARDRLVAVGPAREAAARRSPAVPEPARIGMGPVMTATSIPSRCAALPARRVHRSPALRRRRGLRRADVAARSRCRSTADCTFRGRRLFGDNKTLRGFVVMVPAGAVALPSRARSLDHACRRLPVCGRLTTGEATRRSARGAALGFMAGELPNSFVKRQLDIAPGAASTGRGARVAVRRPIVSTPASVCFSRSASSSTFRGRPGRSCFHRADLSLGLQRPDVPAWYQTEAGVRDMTSRSPLG